jgi:DNA ligase (NAD+)
VKQALEHQMLCALIAYHDHLYYVLNSPEITDYEYDMIFSRLLRLEEKHPELITKQSPSQKVGSDLQEGE